ncbi:MAG: aminotransferase class I/II-fold pyridoxal phosphate-dependent enzyme, partial [Oceanospirillales bacterium]|nr:aminotransferase class I/II-fold pyridoxal phosphate-dependent enzyme [Oceanospirillales bacterium]
APGRYRSQVIHNKFVSTAASSTLSQLAVAQFIAEGGYERHLRKVRAQYQRYRDQMVSWLEEHFPPGIRISYPQGGYLLWVEFAREVDCVELNRELSDRQFRIAPGVLFSATGKYRNCMRLNFVNGVDAQTEEALCVLGDMIRQRYPD